MTPILQGYRVSDTEFHTRTFTTRCWWEDACTLRMVSEDVLHVHRPFDRYVGGQVCQLNVRFMHKRPDGSVRI